MTFSPGQRWGPYEVLSSLGVGGMGEVWRARDTRLQRDVAIKALPRHLADDPERLARLAREARLLASLNHPNVAAIYGLEEADGSPFLVMELVEGQSLAQRLAAGPLPLEDALSVGIQIAAGLEAAHGAGVIHRDLKPANVMIRPDGSVKVLDLGLARTVESAAATDPSMSPTITSAPTGTGVILGTAAYMSPEQARGRPLDKRTDIFSFGCVLYESLTSQRAFPGDTVSDSLAAILRAEPDWGALAGDTPASVRNLLRRCLQKDPRKRLQDIGDARIELDEAASAPREPETATVVLARPRRGRSLLWALGGVLAGVAATLLAGRFLARPAPTAAPSPVRAFLPLPAGVEPGAGWRPALALSPDGRTVVFRAVEQGVARLYRRRLDAAAAEAIPGTEGGHTPFFSPDGQWLGFIAGFELRKLPAAGGSPIRIASVPPVTAGAAWDTDGTVVLPMTVNDALSGVHESSGSIRPVTKLDASRGEHAHLWPQTLPDGRGILVTMVLGQDFQDLASAQIVVVDPKSARRTVVLEGSTFARYANGRLVFVRGGSVFEAGFDLSRLAVTGSPVPLPDRIAIYESNGSASFALSPDGALVYVEGPPISDPNTTVLRLDRTGHGAPLPLRPGIYAEPRLSPDGKTLAIQRCERAPCKLYLYDIARNVLSPFTTEPGRFFCPVWAPDGKRLAYTGFSFGTPALYVKNADGSGRPERLTNARTDTRETAEFADSWSPDGRTIAYTGVHGIAAGQIQRDISLVSADGNRQPRLWFQDPQRELAAAFSPDGRWIAYVAEDVGPPEVYIRPYPGPGGFTKVSTNGGVEPVWTRGGRELLYRQDDKFFSVEVTTEKGLTVGSPRLLFEADLARGGREDRPFEYDASRDGNQIYAIRTVPVPEPERRLAIVTNWLSALGR